MQFCAEHEVPSSSEKPQTKVSAKKQPAKSKSPPSETKKQPAKPKSLSSETEETELTIKYQTATFTLKKAAKGDKHKCQYVFRHGSNPGAECTMNANYCLDGMWFHGTCKEEDDGWKLTAHLKSIVAAAAKEASAPKKKTAGGEVAKAKAKTKAAAREEVDAKTVDLVKAVAANTNSRIIRKHKVWKVHWDPISKMVFDPATSQAIGNLDETTGKVNLLTKENVKECEAFEWKFDRNKVEEDKDESGEDEGVASASKDEHEKEEIGEDELEETGEEETGEAEEEQDEAGEEELDEGDEIEFDAEED